MSFTPLLSPATRFVAADEKKTASPEKSPQRPCRPQPPPDRANAICELSPLPGSPEPDADARNVVPRSPVLSPCEPRMRTYTCFTPDASVTNATRSQWPSTLTSEVAPGPTETRSIRPVWSQNTNASATPFVSPGTRLDASDTNATQRGACSCSPSTSGRYERPLAGAPPSPREIRRVFPILHGGPFELYGRLRRTTNTSVTDPLPSCATRLDASESKAATVASWRSCENAGSCDGPFGKPPLIECDRSCTRGGAGRALAIGVAAGSRAATARK